MILYIAYYTGANAPSSIPYNFGGTSKIDFLIDEFTRIDDVVVYSLAPTLSSKTLQTTTATFSKNGHKFIENYPKCRRSKFKIVNKLLNVAFKKKLTRLVKNDLRQNPQSTIILYHSLLNLKMENDLLKSFPENSILEVEDVYSKTFGHIVPRFKKKEKNEMTLISHYKRCIFVNDLEQGYFKTEKALVSYGVLGSSSEKNDKQDAKTLLYAGIIDHQTGAAEFATEMMRFLPADYQLNICGGGSKQSLGFLIKKIQEVNKELGRTAVAYCGLLSGDDLVAMYVNSSLGLCIENTPPSPDREFFSFHSKILRYFSYGIPVVATDFESEKQSRFANLITFIPKTASAKTAAEIIMTSTFPNQQQLKNKMDSELDFFRCQMVNFLAK